MTGVQIYKSDDLRIYLNTIKKYKLLTKEEEVELAKRISKNDLKALETMVNSNLRLVVKIAKKYASFECRLQDLIQEGNIGLLKSARKFDYKKGVRFSTYASWWIKQSILRYIANKKRMIRLPLRKEEKLKKINNSIDDLSIELRRLPSIAEIALKAGCEKDDIIKLKAVGDNVISIDEEIADGFSMIDVIDSKTSTPEEILEKNCLKEETENILKTLKDKERAVLRARYNLDTDYDKVTFKNIARNLGLSTETVRQIEMKAKKKIRENFSYLKEFLYC